MLDNCFKVEVPNIYKLILYTYTHLWFLGVKEIYEGGKITVWLNFRLEGYCKSERSFVLSFLLLTTLLCVYFLFSSIGLETAE